MQITLLSAGVVVWGVITGVLVGLLIYRTVLGIHEEDQIFLDQAEAAFEKEQVENLAKINRIDPIIKGVAALSVGLLLVIAGVWLYRGLNASGVF
ncbi:MAG: hypothetical protein HYS38_01720 [Acidobacteria bacterium]|nr:hypothetical protein [Acidobacteriota bacterium]